MTLAPTAVAGARSNEVRRARAEIRRGLTDGTVSLADVLTNPDPCIGTVPLFSLILWRRGWAKDHLRRIAAQAIRDNINLGLHLEDAGVRTRAWLIEMDRSRSAMGPKP